MSYFIICLDVNLSYTLSSSVSLLNTAIVAPTPTASAPTTGSVFAIPLTISLLVIMSPFIYSDSNTFIPSAIIPPVHPVAISVYPKYTPTALKSPRTIIARNI